MDLKSAGKRLLRHPAVWKATAPVRTTGCIVLTYHRVGSPLEPFPHVPASEFRSQMRWLRRNCDVIRPDQLHERIVEPSRRERPSVLVTFDDGYRDYLQNAYPALKELGIPAVVFLPTRYVDTGDLFWWDIVDAAVAASARRAAAAPGAPAPLPLDTPERQVAFARRWKTELKRHARPECERSLQDLLAALGVSRDSLRLPRQVMTWDDVRAAADLTTFGGHTHNHPIMSLLDPADLADEVRTCRERIAAETGQRPRLFAYPSGASNDAARAAVAAAGFDAAFTTTGGVNERTVDWMALRRMHGPQQAIDLPILMTGWRHRQGGR